MVTRRDFSVVNGNPLAHARLSVSRGVVVSHAAAETIEGSHLFLSQGKIEDGQVLGKALYLLGLGNRGGASLHGPAQKDLCGGLTVGGGDIFDHLLFDDGWHFTCEIKLNIGKRSEVAERHDCDSLLLAHSEEIGLWQVWVHLDLEHGRLDCGVVEHLPEHHSVDVADTDVLGESLALESLHSLVSLLVSACGVENNLWFAAIQGWVEAEPLGWILLLDGDELEGDGEMNQVQVKVVKTKISQSLLASHLDVLRAMESVPELGNDEEVRPGNNALVNGLADTLSHLDLVTVVAGTVEQSISKLDSVVDDVGANIFWNLPESETKSGDLGFVGKIVRVECCGSIIGLDHG